MLVFQSTSRANDGKCKEGTALFWDSCCFGPPNVRSDVVLVGLSDSVLPRPNAE